MSVVRTDGSLLSVPSRRAVTLAVLASSAALGACDRSREADAPRLAPTAPSAAKSNVASVTKLVLPQGAPLATFNGVNVNYGGYGSALSVDPHQPSIFYSLTDRGANVNVSCAGKSGLGFGVPSFTPQIGKFSLSGTTLTLQGTVTLKQANGSPLTGIPHPNAQANRTEVPYTLGCGPLAQDPLGVDSEGLALAKDGTFWVSDEYGPHIVHFTADGRTIQRLKRGSGLPHARARRRANRGMEGLTMLPDGKTLVGLMQSPLDNPTAGGSSAGRGSRLTRIVVYDTRTGRSRQYADILDATNTVNSEITALTPTSFLVVERDGNFPLAGGLGAIKKVYKLDISHATDISDPADGVAGLLIGGLTLEEITKGAADPYATLAANGITAAKKTLVVDLLQAIPDYPHDKVEGLAVLGSRTIAISNDDDFGVNDDGAGNFIVKGLPQLGGVADFNTIYILRLNAPLKD